MAHISYLDDLIKEYLLHRGFGNTLKCFESDLKTCKDQSFRADKMADALLAAILSGDLQLLLSIWTHLEQKVFSKLDSHLQNVGTELYTALLRRYLAHVAAASGARDKLSDFFTLLTPQLHHQLAWKEWFALPFVRHPEEHAVFGVFFTRQWQDTFAMSLHNFLALAFQCVPAPPLARYQQESALILRLQRENHQLGCRLEQLNLSGGGAGDHMARHSAGPTDIMDDFIVVAQEASVSDSASCGTTCTTSSTCTPSVTSYSSSKSLRPRQ